MRLQCWISYSFSLSQEHHTTTYSSIMASELLILLVEGAVRCNYLVYTAVEACQFRNRVWTSLDGISVEVFLNVYFMTMRPPNKYEKELWNWITRKEDSQRDQFLSTQLTFRALLPRAPCAIILDYAVTTSRENDWKMTLIGLLL